MQVSDPNNVKIYNLSAGKSLPEWLTDRKRRLLVRKNIDIRRRIELIQDFDMPDLSTTIKVSPDGNYILATGIYKPRMKCFEVNNLSMKFERCFDSEVVTFEILSEDYTKVVFLHCDRYVEFHAGHGRYYRLRIPKFGRDLKYNCHTCDLYVSAAGPDIYRLNLERGQFLASFSTSASEVNRMAINPVHNLLMCGTKEGKVEAWDPRTQGCVGLLDCAAGVAADSPLEGFPSVTALSIQGGLTMGVGTATGHVLLYDIRSDKPFLVKDHMYGLPIRDIAFHSAMDQELVVSMDSSVVKIWDKADGKLFTSVEAKDTLFNNLCLVPGTGLFFIANEAFKMQTYYIPSMGPAPRWCAFLDSLTEELEETNMQIVYDDYKFVTNKELEELGLDHLMGTNLLRAYMHGHFMDIRLYRKAKALAEPFAFDDYRKKKIRDKIDAERGSRVVRKTLPKVNKELALKMMSEDTKVKGKQRKTENLLEDGRFKALFEDPDFEVDKTAEEYRLINPAVSKLTKTRKRELVKQIEELQFEEVDSEPEGRGSDEEYSSDEDGEWTKEVQRQHKMIRDETREREYSERRHARDSQALGETAPPPSSSSSSGKGQQPKFFEIREGEDFKGINGRGQKRKRDRAPLGERAEREGDADTEVRQGLAGSRQMTYSLSKPRGGGGSRGGRADRGRERSAAADAEHRKERREVHRSAYSLSKRGSSRGGRSY